jgi:hypothetical protein
MIEKYGCNVDKGDYLEIERVRNYVVFEVVNFQDEETLTCSLASLNKDQVKDLISKLNNMIKEID